MSTKGTVQFCVALAVAALASPVLAHNDQASWTNSGPMSLVNGQPTAEDPTAPVIQLFHSTYSDSVSWFYNGTDWGWIFNVPGGASNTVMSTHWEAPSHSLRIDADGYVGMGTPAPESPLHIQASGGSSNGTAGLTVEETSSNRLARSMLMLKNNGNTKFELLDTGTGTSWAFTNSGQDFRMSNQDSGVVEFRVDNQGNAHLAGSLYENSDVNAKQDINQVDHSEILNKVLALPIQQWSYKDTPKERHIGPMAQDFYAAFGLGAGETSLATIDTAGIALAAIQAIAQENAELREKVAVLEAQNNRLAELEQVVKLMLEREQKPIYTKSKLSN